MKHVQKIHSLKDATSKINGTNAVQRTSQEQKKRLQKKRIFSRRQYKCKHKAKLIPNCPSKFLPSTCI